MWNQVFFGFFNPVVTATAETTYQFPQGGGTTLLQLINDGTVDVHYSLNGLPVDMVAGASGGIIKPNEVQQLPVRTTSLALKAASSTAAVRIWAFGS